MDVYEFVSKMAEQHVKLLRVIELQNSSIQSLNHRINAVGAAEMILFALLFENSTPEQRLRTAQYVRHLLTHSHITENPYLVSQLKEFLEICEDRPKKVPSPAPAKTAPAWFKGVVQGGLSSAPLKGTKNPSD